MNWKTLLFFLMTSLLLASPASAKSEADKTDARIATLETAVADLQLLITTQGDEIGKLQSDLAAATANITQLQSDLIAEVTAREAADNQIDAAYIAADGNLQSQIDAITSVDVRALVTRLEVVEETLTCVAYDAVTYDLIFVGCNVHVRDGSGSTQAATGLGNLIIGYNADPTTLLNRTGAHNLVIGDDQAYALNGQLLTKDIVSSGDLSVLVAHDLAETISGSRRTVLGLDSLVDVGRNLQAIVGNNSSLGVTGNLDVNANDIGVSSSDSFNVASRLTTLASSGDIEIASDADVLVKAAGTITLKGSSINQN